jgi:DNA-directed RNA polymerase
MFGNKGGSGPTPKLLPKQNSLKPHKKIKKQQKSKKLQNNHTNINLHTKIDHNLPTTQNDIEKSSQKITPLIKNVLFSSLSTHGLRSTVDSFENVVTTTSRKFSTTGKFPKLVDAYSLPPGDWSSSSGSKKSRNDDDNDNDDNNNSNQSGTGNGGFKRHKGKRFERNDPLTALLSTISYSYLARTAEVDVETPMINPANSSIEATSALEMPVNAQAKKKSMKKKAQVKPATSAALDLTGKLSIAEQQPNKLRSNIISADAVKKSVRNVYLQYGFDANSVKTKVGLEAILARATEAVPDTTPGTISIGKTKFSDKTASLQHDLDLNKDELHDDADPLGPQATGEDIDGGNDNGKKQRISFANRKKNLVGANIKKSIPQLQRSIFEELDGIVEFANLHYDNVMKALSQHSLSSLYPPELLTVEFFDYRLELFQDAINEDLGALYKAKKLYFKRHLTKLSQSGEISKDDFDKKIQELDAVFSSSFFDLKEVQKIFQNINFQVDDVLVEDLYKDEELGWTSHDTTFVRNRQNSLEDELRLVQAVHLSLGQDIFSVNQFKQGLNIAAHRYPGLNVSIDKYIQQLGYEHQSITRAVDDYTELTDQLTKMGRASHLTPLQDHVLRWFKPLAESIEKEIIDCRESFLSNKPSLLKKGGTDEQDGDKNQQFQHHADLKLILPYIIPLKSTELGCIALHETLSRILNAPSGMRVIDLSLAIGRAVNTEANLLQLRQDRQNFQRLRRYYPGAKLNEQVIRRAVTNQNRKADGAGANNQNAGTPSLGNNNGNNNNNNNNNTNPMTPNGAPLDSFGHQMSEDGNWSDLIQAKVGSFLIKNMLQSSTLKQIVDPVTGKLISAEGQHKHLRSGSEVEVPAFSYEHRQVGYQYIGYLNCHADVRNVIDRAHTDVQALAVRLLPMVIPPRPWRGVRDGGYLSVPSSIIRSKGSRKQVQAVDASDIKSVQDSLNYLGRVAWSINPHVLSVIDQAWSEGGGFAAMPSRRDIPVPPQPTLNLLQYDEKRGRYFSPSQQQVQQANKSGSLINPEQLAQQTTQWRQWQRDTQRISQYNADLHSLRCDLTLRLNQAKQLAANPVFFPLNMDFRGRAYPIPPHLNHLGADLARALLLFHNKKPLGEKGLYWLKAHLAAQFGVDKVSFDDRVKYVEEHMALVMDTAKRPMFANTINPHYGKLRSLDEPLYPIPREVQQKYARVYIRQQLDAEPNEQAKKTKLKSLLAEYQKQGLTIDLSIEDDPNECIHPLDGERDVRFKLPWWQLADNPWQALSTCAEIVNASESPDPAAYETGLPVHQDGSCNGLQHYAALGRDYAGGSRVNLTKSDKPQDVYSHVLHEVKRRMEQDIKETDNPLAKMLLPHMARKVVKQTVMTSVYGVTFIGARDQILKQLRDLKDVPWDEASALVLQQQIDNRKKFLSKQNDVQQRNKLRQRNTLLKSMTESQRIEFLNQEMLEQTLTNELVDALGEDPLADDNKTKNHIDNGNIDPLIMNDDPDQAPLVEGGGRSQTAKSNITRDEDGVIRANVDGSDKDILMTQRQAQEAAMRASSIYLARLTLTSLGTVFSAATRIMSWLTECATIISKQEQPVSWITPMQLPVVQHYRLIAKYQVKTLNQTVTLHHDNDSLPVSPQRQRAAFPPNFVHSLDATHMMLTAAQCAQHGIVFSSVHDSYWTHPGDIDKMNALLRDRFIHLYSGPVLEDLRESFVLRYPTAEFPPLPERGDLDLEEVRSSPYFFN